MMDVETFRQEAGAWLAEHMERRDPLDDRLNRPIEEWTEEYLAEQRVLQRRLHEGGYAGISWPEKFGGRGLTPAHEQAFVEEARPPDDDPKAREAKLAIEADLPEAIGFIRSSTTKMDNLINAILKLSREGRRTLKRQRVDMNQLFETAADSLRHQISERGGEIEVHRPMPAVNSDRLALEQIFGNLLDNAVKYLDPNRPGRIVVRGREIRNGAEFEVADNGRGFNPAKPGRSEGGFGLVGIRERAKEIKAELQVQSSPGQGTRIALKLPLAAE